MLRRRGWGRGEGRRDCARWFVLRVRVACVVVSEWGRAGAPASSIRRRRFQSVVGGASKTGRRHAPSGSRTHDRERCPPTATDARPARRPTADGDWGLRAPMCRERHQQCRGDRGSRGQLSIMSVSCAQTTGPAHCSRSAGERRDTDERTASEVPCWRRAADGLRCVPVDRPLRRPGPGSVPPRRLPNCRGIPFARSSVGSSSFPGPRIEETRQPWSPPAPVADAAEASSVVSPRMRADRARIRRHARDVAALGTAFTSA